MRTRRRSLTKKRGDQRKKITNPSWNIDNLALLASCYIDHNNQRKSGG